MANANLSSNVPGKLAVVTKSLRDHWRLYVAEGILLIILGAAAIIVPAVASVAAEIFLGWLFLIGGGFALVTTALNRHAPGFWWSLLSAAVTIAAGMFLVGWPMKGVISLTFVLTAFLVADGVLTILFAVEHRRALSQRWGWMFTSGVLDLVLAGIIVWALPESAIWALGLIVGVDMLFGGFSLIAIALVARRGEIL